MSEAESPAVLFVAEETSVVARVARLFGGELPVLTARSAEEGLARLKEREVGVVVADQRQGMAGELLAQIAQERPEVVRIVLTASTEVESSLPSGGVDRLILKPWDDRELVQAVYQGMDTYRLRVRHAASGAEDVPSVEQMRAADEWAGVEKRAFRRGVNGRHRPEILGASRVMHDLVRLLEKASESLLTVLLTGETGTGKELAASWIHHNGARRAQKFVVVNCSAMPETLLESELFGHVKGAFTGALRDRRGLFEEANGGTIFLDEIGEMSPAMQVKVLRVIEDGVIRPVGGSTSAHVDVRVISATNRDLGVEVKAGRFRGDLFYRLNVFPITLPPLRAREADVCILAQHFLNMCNAQTGKQLRGFSPGSLHCLERYPWPGNIRELKNEIERAVALADVGETIDLRRLSPNMLSDEALPTAAAMIGELRTRLRRFEALTILQELRRHGENRTQTARDLGISLRALQKKIARYGLHERVAWTSAAEKHGRSSRPSRAAPQPPDRRRRRYRSIQMGRRRRVKPSARRGDRARGKGPLRRPPASKG